MRRLIKPRRPRWLHEPPADGVLRHPFVHHLPHYAETPCCGFVQVAGTLPGARCKACSTPLQIWRPWFPKEVYEYAVILEDYHARPPSELRERYFEATAEDNAFQCWCAESPPELLPTQDWKPVTIMIFRTLFELLLEQFLWRVIHIQLSPSKHAGAHASFELDSAIGVTERFGRLYRFVTDSRWSSDLERLGYSDIDSLLKRTAKTRNAFLHENPYAGGKDRGLAQQSRDNVPRLLELFVHLANEYYHPRAKELRSLEAERGGFTVGEGI